MCCFRVSPVTSFSWKNNRFFYGLVECATCISCTFAGFETNKSETKDKILNSFKLIAKFSFPEDKKSELFFSEMVVAVLKYSHWEAVILVDVMACNTLSLSASLRASSQGRRFWQWHIWWSGKAFICLVLKTYRIFLHSDHWFGDVASCAGKVCVAEEDTVKVVSPGISIEWLVCTSSGWC